MAFYGALDRNRKYNKFDRESEPHEIVSHTAARNSESYSISTEEYIKYKRGDDDRKHSPIRKEAYEDRGAGDPHHAYRGASESTEPRWRYSRPPPQVGPPPRAGPLPQVGPPPRAGPLPQGVPPPRAALPPRAAQPRRAGLFPRVGSPPRAASPPRAQPPRAGLLPQVGPPPRAASPPRAGLLHEVGPPPRAAQPARAGRHGEEKQNAGVIDSKEAARKYNGVLVSIR